MSGISFITAANTLTALLVLSTLFGCSPRERPAVEQPAEEAGGSPPQKTDPGAPALDIRIVNPADLDALRSNRRYALSEPRGEISAVATCASGVADESCTEAARQQLREEAAKRGANLVVIVGSALMQSYPPRLTLRAVLYELRSRP